MLVEWNSSLGEADGCPCRFGKYEEYNFRIKHTSKNYVLEVQSKKYKMPLFWHFDSQSMNEIDLKIEAEILVRGSPKLEIEAEEAYYKAKYLKLSNDIDFINKVAIEAMKQFNIDEQKTSKEFELVLKMQDQPTEFERVARFAYCQAQAMLAEKKRIEAELLGVKSE